MIGYKILTKQGLKGPYLKSSILKAITSAQIPLQARLLDLETGRYMSAAERVGENVDPEPKVNFDSDKSTDSSELRLDEDAGVPVRQARGHVPQPDPVHVLRSAHRHTAGLLGDGRRLDDVFIHQAPAEAATDAHLVHRGIGRIDADHARCRGAGADRRGGV